MFTVDLLHEIELGVWKSLLTHLVRILFGLGADVVAKFNHRFVFSRIYAQKSSHMCQRFRQVPTFCNSTIRKFSNDVASLSRLAARDFEDILQVSRKVLIPVTIRYLTPPLSSVVFPFLKACCPSRLTLKCSNFCSLFHIGTRLQNFDNTRPILLPNSATSQYN